MMTTKHDGPTDADRAAALIVALELELEPLDREMDRLEDALEECDYTGTPSANAAGGLFHAELEKLDARIEALNGEIWNLEEVGLEPEPEPDPDAPPTRLVRAKVGQGAREYLRRALGDVGVDSIDFEWSGFADGSTSWAIVFWTDLALDPIRDAIWEYVGWCDVEELPDEEPYEEE